MTKILVFGGWFGSGNLGDDAILIGLRRVLNNVMKDVEIAALSSNPDYTRRVCGVEAIRLQGPRSIIRRNRAFIESYHVAFRDADMCIVSGGTPIYDYGHLSRIIHFYFPKTLGKKLYCFGIGVKPISSRGGARLLRALLHGVDRISVRDRLSKAELGRIGVEKPVVVTSDSALYLVPAEPAVGLRKLSECGVDTNKPMVAICPRALSTNHRAHYHEPISARAISAIRRSVARVADHLSGLGYEVVFLPMHKVPPDDDLVETGSIARLMRIEAPKIVDVDLQPGEAMAVLGRMRLVFGLRLHSLIFAAAQGVPIVGVDYDPKIRGFMELAGVSDYLCKPTDPPRVFVEKVEKALEGEDALSKMLLSSCESMRSRIEEEARQIGICFG
jgi:polysaccharide pyruvyl transferase WcaK-like protein